MKALIDFKMDSKTVASPDGSLHADFTNVTVVQGPGNTSLGRLPSALDLGTTGKGVCNISSLAPNAKQFCVTVIFKATKPVASRQNLVESGYLPFAIYLNKGSATGKFNLVTSLKPKHHDWNGPDTQFKRELDLNRWYTVSLVYDFDTVALFINQSLISVHAFPEGTIDLMRGRQLFFGTWVDGKRNHFNGQLAAFQLTDGIPADLEALLDARRNHAEWFISFKSEVFKKQYNMGARTGPLQLVGATGATIQHYQRCAVMYHYSMGVAYEMHGSIYQMYKAMRNRNSLGYLITDESDTIRARGKKSLFSKGGIYWSSTTGAHPVLGQIYAEYENTGESGAWGFPVKPQRSVSGGYEQEFQRCRMYYRHGAAKAHEVHGSILEKFLAKGGIGKWGFPVSNETDIKKGSATIGRYSEFEKCTIYWKSGLGAFEVHGDIRRKYNAMGGPLSDLGFPTSDESRIAGASGARGNSFQKGSILWYGSYGSILIARPFKIRINRLNTKESEGFGMGQNDLYFKTLSLTQDGTRRYHKKRPQSGTWSGNIVNVNHTIPVIVTPNKLNTKIKLLVDVWESDSAAPFGGGNDHMGKYTKELNASNGWGLRENNGVYDVKFKKVKSLTWSVVPQINMNNLTENEKWWGSQSDNRGTPVITYSQYASAFKGVDSEREWWDVPDWLEKAFYELVVKDIAKGGNCFGMSLEGVNARKGNSVFPMPVDRFSWNQLVKEFNIKQSYQVGANPIWWFLGQFLTGNTHNPTDVFNETLQEFNRGNDPVICLSQNYDFSGAPHCVLPVKWDKSSKPWRITINDPNGPTTGAVLTVNPDNNTFRYQRQSGSALYEGGQWSGGRLHYMPYSLLCGKQRLIVWDLLQLLLAGTILILADDGETVSITDTEGNDLNAYGQRAAHLMKQGKSVSGFFAGFNGFETAISPGQILLRREDRMSPIQRAKIASADPERVAGALSSENFVHTVKGKKNGQFKYLIKNGLNAIRLESSLRVNETHMIELQNAGTHFCHLKMNGSHAKNVKLEIFNHLGNRGDYQLVQIDNFPLSKENELEVNVKQGLGGIELLNKGSQFNLKVNVSSRINQVDFKKDYQINLDKGVRIMPSSLIHDKVLQVSPIDSLLGKSLGTFRM